MWEILKLVLGGGATGLLGVLFQKYFDYKTKQADIELVRVNNEHARLLAEMDMRKAERAAQATEHVADAQAEAQVRTAEQEAIAKAEEAAAKQYIASMEQDRATYLDAQAQSRSRFARIMMTIVDSVRGLIRPVLTLYLVVLATVMFYWARDLAGQQSALSADAAGAIVVQIVNTLLYLASTCVVWWFGVRPTQKEKAI